jgi:hypothetical protein
MGLPWDCPADKHQNYMDKFKPQVLWIKFFDIMSFVIENLKVDRAVFVVTDYGSMGLAHVITPNFFDLLSCGIIP